jgi:predicted HTH domain antitoxin
MKIEIPDSVVGEKNADKFLLELACTLYGKANVSLPRCARIAGLSRDDFQHELWKRKIPLQYDVDDLNTDIENLKHLK